MTTIAQTVANMAAAARATAAGVLKQRNVVPVRNNPDALFALFSIGAGTALRWYVVQGDVVTGEAVVSPPMKKIDASGIFGNRIRNR